MKNLFRFAVALVVGVLPILASGADAKVKIILVGDSTVTDKSGWGLGFKELLTDDAECINTSAGGRSSRSFIAEGKWKAALALKGDYYLIQFGHNDQPGKGPERETEPETTYRDFMSRYVDEARAIGAKPVLVTSLTRREWNKSGDGKITSSLEPYVAAVRKIAAEKYVPLIDLHTLSKELCEQLGQERCNELSPVVSNKVDNTHLNAKGSRVFARLVVAGLTNAVPELTPCFSIRGEAFGKPQISKSAFDVTRFGAVGDGTTFDTEAIQKALDACKESGGTVEFPPGNYLSQPLKIYSKTIFKLDAGATLLASTNQMDFMKTPGDWLAKGASFIPFIGGKDLTDVTFTGGGTIDGNGFVWWPEAEKARQKKSGYTLPRPNLIVIERSKNLRFENITLQNSPKFHLVPTDCDDVVISNVTFLAPERAANTDAMDPSGHRYLITHCKVDVGDDNIAIKAGKKSAGGTFRSEDFTITDCTFLHGHGMSIGSETAGGVRNITVRDCTFENTENGIRIKSDTRRGGIVENIFCDNITMKNVNPAITLTTVYQGTSASDKKAGDAQTNSPDGGNLPVYRNIRIKNLTATCPKAAGLILGLPESCVSNVLLDNVSITAAAPFAITHAKGVRLKNVVVTVPNGVPFKLDDAEVSGLPTPAVK